MKSRIVCIIQFNNQYTFQECVNSPKLTNERQTIKDKQSFRFWPIKNSNKKQLNTCYIISAIN